MKDGPFIVLSAAGMLTGGRILHHLKARLPDAKNAVIFVGFQAEGTKGRLLQQGLQDLRIHHADISVEAEIFSLPSLSAHADSKDLMDWLRNFQKPPRKIFLNHGEPGALEAMKYRIEHEMQTEVICPNTEEYYIL
jgi:metallo-beta-lactamase family protein